MVNLVAYHSGFDKSLENYELTEDQVKYTEYPKQALPKCEQDSGRHPVIIELNEEAAGFFVLYQGEELPTYTANENAVLLRAYSVSLGFQGQGIAKKSLALLPQYVKATYPEATEVVLAVNHRNEIAQKVYLNAGFTDTHRIVIGRMGEQFIYQLTLKEEEHN
ncbi:GNAT family N-acetyltransferase [Sutcliffiella rhizosphaerae]|nr:GNAT family N-acetyltransferase [Sutcliffiella rhizosphaerae]